jgi:type I restriction enzyme M protein
VAIDQNHITQGKIETYLFEAANILRGPVDASDFKTYIFPLLFFKRLCDVYDEEMRVAIDAHGEAFPEDHRYRIPDGCHWSDIRLLSTNIGTQLQHALKRSKEPTRFWQVFSETQLGVTKIVCLTLC